MLLHHLTLIGLSECGCQTWGHGPRWGLGGDSDALGSLPAHHLPALSRADRKGRSQRGSRTSSRSLFGPLSLRGSAFCPLWS